MKWWTDRVESDGTGGFSDRCCVQSPVLLIYLDLIQCISVYNYLTGGSTDHSLDV